MKAGAFHRSSQVSRETGRSWGGGVECGKDCCERAAGVAEAAAGVGRDRRRQWWAEWVASPVVKGAAW